MGRTKDLQIEIRATMSEDVFQGIPEHLRDEMTIKVIDVVNFKEEYKKHSQWVYSNQKFIDALKAKKEIEDQIRVNLRNE